MKLKIVSTIVLIHLYSVVNVFAYEHPGGLHTKAQLAFVKKQIAVKNQPYYNAYLQLLSRADSAFLHEKHALADFSVPGYYKDPATHRKNSAGFQSDAFDAYACALAYQLSGKKKYAEKALEYMMAWANINTKYSEFDGSLVMVYSGTAMIMAGELMLEYKDWMAPDKQKFFTWTKNVYQKACMEIRNRKNNWADWGRFGSVLCAYMLDNQEEMNENIRLIKSDIFHKIENDGHMPEETRREKNGIWYTYFSLAPITASCYVVYNTSGENLFELKEGNKSIKNALDYLLYYSQNPKEWPWFKDPNPGNPAMWPGNLMEAMANVYDEKKYAEYVEKSRPLCYPTHHFAWTFPTLMPPMLSFPKK